MPDRNQKKVALDYLREVGGVEAAKRQLSRRNRQVVRNEAADRRVKRHRAAVRRGVSRSN